MFDTSTHLLPVVKINQGNESLTNINKDIYFKCRYIFIIILMHDIFIFDSHTTNCTKSRPKCGASWFVTFLRTNYGPQNNRGLYVHFTIVLSFIVHVL
jgi:hypothetical protein